MKYQITGDYFCRMITRFVCQMSLIGMDLHLILLKSSLTKLVFQIQPLPVKRTVLCQKLEWQTRLEAYLMLVSRENHWTDSFLNIRQSQTKQGRPKSTLIKGNIFIIICLKSSPTLFIRAFPSLFFSSFSTQSNFLSSGHIENHFLLHAFFDFGKTN